MGGVWGIPLHMTRTGQASFQVFIQFTQIRPTVCGRILWVTSREMQPIAEDQKEVWDATLGLSGARWLYTSCKRKAEFHLPVQSCKVAVLYTLIVTPHFSDR